MNTVYQPVRGDGTTGAGSAMPTSTRNLFRGQAERAHALDVVEGCWPDDVDTPVETDPGVEHRCVDTPVPTSCPWLFERLQFMELSPFGVSNLANTGVQALGDRLFVGYDAGRPVEIDPESLEHLTPVGANDEWLQGAPGTFEPLCAVAAHPAAISRPLDRGSAAEFPIPTGHRFVNTRASWPSAGNRR